MAKVTAPLMSFGARGKIANSLVFFPWKGINAVRQYVIPTNPKTDRQIVQRGYFEDAIDAIHSAQAAAVDPLDAADVVANALWGSTYPTPRTWFNQVVKNYLDVKVASGNPVIYRNGTLDNSVATQLAASILPQDSLGTAGKFYYGISKTALIHSEAAAFVGGKWTATITGLTAGTKYYVQYRPDAGDPDEGSYSGIYTEYST